MTPLTAPMARSTFFSKVSTGSGGSATLAENASTLPSSSPESAGEKLSS